MSVGNVESILSTLSSQYNTAVAESDDGSMHMDDFLTVFLAQLEYQDPLSPMEGTEVTSQLAQMTSVEQQYNTNAKLDVISQELQDLSSAGVLQYIGKDVRIEDSSLTVEDGESLGTISFTLDETAEVAITIYDSDGNAVRQVDAGEIEAGSYQVEWDGKDADGNTVGDGSYTYEILATGVDGDSATRQIENTLRITGVTYQDGSPYLLSGDLQIDPASVLSVHGS